MDEGKLDEIYADYVSKHNHKPNASQFTRVAKIKYSIAKRYLDDKMDDVIVAPKPPKKVINKQQNVNNNINYEDPNAFAKFGVKRKKSRTVSNASTTSNQSNNERNSTNDNNNGSSTEPKSSVVKVRSKKKDPIKSEAMIPPLPEQATNTQNGSNNINYEDPHAFAKFGIAKRKKLRTYSNASTASNQSNNENNNNKNRSNSIDTDTGVVTVKANKISIEPDEIKIDEVNLIYFCYIITIYLWYIVCVFMCVY